MRFRLLRYGALVLTTLWTAAGHADESPLELTLLAPPECPTGSTVRTDVLRLAAVGAPPARRLDAQIAVVRSADSSWTLTLQTDWEGISGERVLVGQSCRAVLDAATLTLALVLNPDFETPLKPDRRGPHPMASEPLGAADRGRLRWFGVGQIGLNSGVMPHLGSELALGPGVGWRSASVWLLARYSPPESATVDVQPSVGGRLWALSAAGFGCWSTNPSPVIGFCIGAELSRVEGYGVGVSNSRIGVIYWVSAMLGIAADVPLNRSVALRIAGFALVPLARPKAFLQDIGPVYRPDALGERIDMGIVFGLP